MASLPIHRDGDLRLCGAKTKVVGQATVFANLLLVSVDKDPCTHGEGELTAKNKQVFAENIMIVNHTPEKALPCTIKRLFNPLHPVSDTNAGSPDVFVGD